MTTISTDEARKLIEDMVDAAGSQRKVARSLGITDSYLSDILNRRRGISEEVAKKLGYDKETVFAPINK